MQSQGPTKQVGTPNAYRNPQLLTAGSLRRARALEIAEVVNSGTLPGRNPIHEPKWFRVQG